MRRHLIPNKSVIAIHVAGHDPGETANISSGSITVRTLA
jgi:hypothetical protein